MIPPIPWPQFDAEVALVRHLVHERPWGREGGATNTAMRAAFRRWMPSDDVPTPAMLAPLWRPRVPTDGWRGLNEPDLDRAVSHAALVLHLLAQGSEPETPGLRVTNLGAAAHAAGVIESRFARLVNTPPSARLEQLSRLFRRFRQRNVLLLMTADKPEEGEIDRRSSRRTLEDSRYDDLAALLAFLFTDDPKRAVSRWAKGFYYHPEASTPNVDAA